MTATVCPRAREKRFPLNTITVSPTAMIPTKAAAVRIAFRLLTVMKPVVVTAPYTVRTANVPIQRPSAASARLIRRPSRRR